MRYCRCDRHHYYTNLKHDTMAAELWNKTDQHCSLKFYKFLRLTELHLTKQYTSLLKRINGISSVIMVSNGILHNIVQIKYLLLANSQNSVHGKAETTN